MPRRALLLVLPIVLIGPATADAFTSSSISTPADGTRFVRTSATDTITLGGTTSGGAFGENVGFRCDPPPALSPQLLATTPQTTTAGDGSFATTSASTANVLGGCLLRAVPDGVVDVAPFAGRWLIFERRLDLLDGATMYGFEDFVQQGAGGTGIRPLGVIAGAGGGLSNTRLTDTPNRLNSYDLFFYGGAILVGDLSVDDRPAYTPTHAFAVAPGAPGSPALTVTRSRDGTADDAVVSESNPLVRCSGDVVSCTNGFQSAGVRWDRTTTTDADGTAFEQRDTLTSTDGAAHSVAAWIGYSALTGGGDTPAFGLSWVDGGARTPRPAGAEFAGPAGRPPVTLFVNRSAEAVDSDPLWPRGAITWDTAPSVVRFGGSKEAAARFEGITVPASGSATLHTRYLAGTRAAALAAGAQKHRDVARAPALTLGGTVDGGTVLTPGVTLRGSASDTEGLASLVVAGRAVTPAADGSFSVTLPLALGSNRLEAVATDAAGQATRAALTVTHEDRISPALTALRLSRGRVRAGRSLTVRFRLGEAAPVTLTISRAGARKVLCSLRPSGRHGANRVTLPTRMGKTTLAPGRYRVAATARDAAGNVSRTQRGAFRVTRR